MSQKLDPDTEKQIRELIETDEDWIYIRRYGYSLATLREKHPDGVPDKLVAEVLGIDDEDLDGIYTNIVLRLRELMKVEPND